MQEQGFGGPREMIIEELLYEDNQMCRQSEASITALPGIDETALSTIRRVMRECNYGWGRGEET